MSEIQPHQPCLTKSHPISVNWFTQPNHRSFSPTIIAVTFALLVLFGWQGTTPALAGEDDAPIIKVGERVPDFTLTNLEGKSVSLHDYKGKIVILEWFNPDCPFVKAAHTKGILKNLGNKISKKKSVVWLAINSGAPGKQGAGLEHNQRMKKKYNINYPILLDEAGKVGRLYGAKKTPHMFVIDGKGILRYQGAIDNDPFAEKNARGEKVISYVELALRDVEEGTEVASPVTKPYGCTVKYAPKSKNHGG